MATAMTKEDLGDLIHNKLLSDIESHTHKLVAELWPHIEKALNAEWNAGIGRGMHIIRTTYSESQMLQKLEDAKR